MAAAAAAARERRREQLRRWEAAVAAAPPAQGPPQPPRARSVRFERAAEFRAVCAGADLAEARAMVRAGGRALLGGANADGISALHQACIDENMEVVQFLVESGADVNQADNEGWTPLHVAASCGYRDIAEYLLAHGADVAAVTSDGELPLEVAEDEGLEELLREEVERRGVDVAAAKRAEEERMLRDTRRWLDAGEIRDARHPATGASALHVAAAKGYIEVMRLLLQAGYDPDVRDKDGWTPLHAAAHWGVEEACRLLAEHLCDMAPRNNVGQRPCDLADEETLPLLEELQRRQHHLRSQKDPGTPPAPITLDPDGAPASTWSSKHRRSSVCRMSSREKMSVQDQSKERPVLGVLPPPADEDSGDEGETPPQMGPPMEMAPLSPPNGVPAGPPVKGPSAGLCRTGSLGALPPPAPPPDFAVRRSASSPRLDSAPQHEESRLNWPWPGQSEHSLGASQPGGGSMSKEPRLARVPPTPSHRTPSDAVPSNPIDGAPPVKVDAEPRPRRTYQPPVRDEESESQRKARSRMMRQSRRSTQGVTLTELKEAEKAIGHIGEEQPIREGERRDEQPPESTDPSRRPHPPLTPILQLNKEAEPKLQSRQRRKGQMGSEGEENEEQGSSEESPKSNGILAAPRPPPSAAASDRLPAAL
ncbi:protein phosphatase 1 regulatory subunit 12C-like isoform X1 [Gallus gallus]|uniref:protein phosphatase 1 regulatory subunit 12C-like isoform X1 n=1 Tax=Gallus gallus TaxID=9031 RepID=UPI001AE172EF|nr:protein phosphatase 1 regulatory subunit 12C-like isoform X1 [Gallus gallus]XP_040550944.1 protein phosphatase 1 regulatory subunit 12C-like isoform X1 [Gallus gallus]